MVPILFPDLPSLPVLVREMAQEEIQVLLTLGKLIFKELKQFLHGRLRRRVRDLPREQIQVFLRVREILLRIQLPAGLHMPWDEFLRLKRTDQRQRLVPCF